MISYEEFLENLSSVQAQIEIACEKAGRAPESVMLLPVTKNHPAEAVEYCERAGLVSVGENRVQEALGKQNELDVNVQWELIGHLQSNKSKQAVASFDRIQSVDSLKLAKKLNTEAAKLEKVQKILFQVNAGADPNKFGVAVEESKAVILEVLKCENLNLEGLMTIAPLSDDVEVAKNCFKNLREVRDELTEQTGSPLHELSMGMSGDLEVAIGAGSTMVRVGTALFGKREY